MIDLLADKYNLKKIMALMILWGFIFSPALGNSAGTVSADDTEVILPEGNDSPTTKKNPIPKLRLNNNFRVSLIAFLAKTLVMEYEFKIGKRWTLGPLLAVGKREVTSSDFNGPVSVSITQLGLKGNLYFSGTLCSGWYFSPILGLASIKGSGTTNSGVSVSGSLNGMTLSALGGYHWFWENFNLNLGVGPSVYFGSGTFSGSTGSNNYDVSIASTGALTPYFDFSLGYAF